MQHNSNISPFDISKKLKKELTTDSCIVSYIVLNILENSIAGKYTTVREVMKCTEIENLGLSLFSILRVLQSEAGHHTFNRLPSNLNSENMQIIISHPVFLEAAYKRSC